MALTLTETASGVMGNQRYWFGTLAFDNSYPTGGEALAATALNGFTTTIRAVSVGTSEIAAKRVVWDVSAAKFLVYVEDGTSGIEAQAANASDQSAVVDIPIQVWGY